MPFQIHEITEGDCLRLKLIGELDLASVRTLEKCLAPLRTERIPLVMDLSELEYMDSTGRQVMIDALRDARRDGWDLRIDPDLAPAVMRILQFAQVHGFLIGNEGNPP